ncbi:hydrolase [Streptomyces silaceus]|uniref:hydrolase n=1 Tax=Streptomyces silaceus TaxID=545123 RepID=UPI0006EB522A|nr:hydrolase [Streptomyces silaceus]
MSLWTSLEPSSTTVDPGDTTTVQLRVRNTGDVVEAYRLEPVGDLAPWTTVEPAELRLYPGTIGTVELRCTPPRTPDVQAGPHPYAVRITPTEHPGAGTVAEGQITVTPFTEVRAELVPPVVRGWFRARPLLAVDNLGNTRVTASLSGGDTGDQLSYELDPGSVQIEPGRAAFVQATLRPEQIIWLGAQQKRPYALAVRRSGTEPIDVNGTFVQRGILPGWLAVVFALLLAATIAFVTVWLSYRPQMQTATREKPRQAGELKPDGKDPLPSKPAPEPEEKEKPKDDGGGDKGGTQEPGGGGGGGDEKPKEEERTAATAVRELAARSEGRHICYRAFVEGDGWQDPVCDGAEAGTTGKGTAIKALNVAVSGTGGVTGASAYVGEGWRKGDEWQKGDDATDMVIGSTEESDPPMQGYTLQVFDGSVCLDAYLQGKEWLEQTCTDPGQWKYGGSPMEQNIQLEAVRFTV